MTRLRQTCIFDGCKMLGRNKGRGKYGVIYDLYCEVHHRLRCKTTWYKEKIDNSKCENCGWDKAPCDRHRKNNKVGYTKSNVVVLCPNCHRLETLGLLTL